MKLREHADLRPLNTFALPARARFLAEVDGDDELRVLLADARVAGLPRILLGGGSNLVFTGGEVEALFIRLCAQGWRVLADDGDRVLVEADAGLSWHALVTACVQAGYNGLENLALIPGTVGAAPVQNIGAYGTELESVLQDLDAMDLRDGSTHRLARADCAFAYRDSLFKRPQGAHLGILRVRLALARSRAPVLAYRDLQEELAARGNPPVDAALVFDMVCAIRRRKLPDPAETGNAGSFFKNPAISAAYFAQLQARFPAVPGHVQPDGSVKVAAGWLIDQAGWKGFRAGDAGVHARQALVLVNHGAATGAQVLALAQRIVDDVQARYGIALEMEPRVIAGR